MEFNLAAGQTRIDQHTALQWAWLLLQKIYQESPREELALDGARSLIHLKLIKLGHGENVDFDALIKELREEALQ